MSKYEVLQVGGATLDRYADYEEALMGARVLAQSVPGSVDIACLILDGVYIVNSLDSELRGIATFVVRKRDPNTPAPFCFSQVAVEGLCPPGVAGTPLGAYYDALTLDEAIHQATARCYANGSDATKVEVMQGEDGNLTTFVRGMRWGREIVCFGIIDQRPVRGYIRFDNDKDWLVGS